jgi:hypothetical protein
MFRKRTYPPLSARPSGRNVPPDHRVRRLFSRTHQKDMLT